MRKALRQIFPPIVISALKFLRTKFMYAEWEYVPEGWAYSGKQVKGWNLESIAQLQYDKWAAFCRSIDAPNHFGVNHEAESHNEPDLNSHNLVISFNYVCCLAVNEQNTLKMLDWGGGIGHYGYIAQSALKDTNVDYWCYDLEAFRATALKVMPGVHFGTDIRYFQGQQFDLVNVGSSIWYDPQWKDTLQQLTQCTHTYIYLSRMVFVDHASSYVAIQRPYSMGYKTEYLCWIFNRSEFIAYLEFVGFTLEREFYLGPAAFIYNAPEQGRYLGFLFKRIN
jgi:putative methyltransferase (TIGR04325 family)